MSEENPYILPDLPHGRRWKIYQRGNLIYVELQVRVRWGRWKTVFKDFTGFSNGAEGVRVLGDKIMRKVERAEAEIQKRGEIPFGIVYGKEKDS